MLENWLSILGYEGSYEVSDLGRVRSVGREYSNWQGKCYRYGKILSPLANPRGYQAVVLYRNGKKDRRQIHRLVMEAFVGVSDGFHVDHINFNPSDNRLSNLQYLLPSDNVCRKADGQIRDKSYGVKFDKDCRKWFRTIRSKCIDCNRRITTRDYYNSYDEAVNSGIG